MMRILVILTLFFSIESMAQEAVPEWGLFYVGMQEIYKGDLAAADSVLNSFDKTSPGDYSRDLLGMNYHWWMIIHGDALKLHQPKFDYYADNLIGEIAKEDVKDNPANLYALITTYAFKSRMHILEEKYLSSILNLKSSMGYLNQSFGMEKVFPPFLITSGLYDYYMDYGSKNYPVLVPYVVFYKKGDMSRGMSLLKEAVRSSDPLIQTEALYFLLQTYGEAEKNYKEAVNYSRILIKNYPGNLLYRLLLFRFLLLSGDKSSAMEEYKNMNIVASTTKYISVTQKNHFLSLARKELEEFYKRS